MVIHLDAEQTRRLAIKFWTDVQTSDGCWVWEGSANADGYGYLSAFSRTLLAHRVSYFLANGYWAEPCTRHLCHNPICVNPGHLIQGTHQDNQDDRKAMLAGIDLLELARSGL